MSRSALPLISDRPASDVFVPQYGAAGEHSDDIVCVTMRGGSAVRCVLMKAGLRLAGARTAHHNTSALMGAPARQRSHGDNAVLSTQHSVHHYQTSENFTKFGETLLGRFTFRSLINRTPYNIAVTASDDILWVGNDWLGRQLVDQLLLRQTMIVIFSSNISGSLLYMISSRKNSLVESHCPSL